MKPYWEVQFLSLCPGTEYNVSDLLVATFSDGHFILQLIKKITKPATTTYFTKKSSWYFHHLTKNVWKYHDITIGIMTYIGLYHGII